MLARRMAGGITSNDIVGALVRFTGPNLTATLSRLEAAVQGVTATDCQMFLDGPQAGREALSVAGELKRQSAQINVTNHALKFLRGGRALSSILSRNDKLHRTFTERFGDDYRTVSAYYADHADAVRIEDVPPWLSDLAEHLISDTGP